MDLHLHSLASDGTLPPSEVIALASLRGLRTVALTDHDTTMGIPSALIASRELDIEVIPGIEMTAAEQGEELHILGYFIDTDNQKLQETLARLRTLRATRAQRIVKVLADLGMIIDWADISRQTWESIGRPHVARLLVSHGYAATPKEAFDRYLDPGRPAYVALHRPRAEAVIKLIRDAGGVSSLAHPIIPGRDEPTSRIERISEMLPALKEAGLNGLESYYPEYAPDVVQALAGLAESMDMVPTGGSDFHTPDGRVSSPGWFGIPLSSLSRLRQLSRSLREENRVALRH